MAEVLQGKKNVKGPSLSGRREDCEDGVYSETGGHLETTEALVPYVPPHGRPQACAFTREVWGCPRPLPVVLDELRRKSLAPSGFDHLEYKWCHAKYTFGKYKTPKGVGPWSKDARLLPLALFLFAQGGACLRDKTPPERELHRNLAGSWKGLEMRCDSVSLSPRRTSFGRVTHLQREAHRKVYDL